MLAVDFALAQKNCWRLPAIIFLGVCASLIALPPMTHDWILAHERWAWVSIRFFAAVALWIFFQFVLWCEPAETPGAAHGEPA